MNKRAAPADADAPREDREPTQLAGRPPSPSNTTTTSTSTKAPCPYTLAHAQAELRAMVAERDWAQFHTPRNLLLALTGEVGELAEIFQWRGEVGGATAAATTGSGLSSFSDADKQKVRDEVADVFAYLVRFADVCGIDILEAFREKMVKNRAKYPPELCRGSSAKYTKYESQLAAPANGGPPGRGADERHPAEGPALAKPVTSIRK